MPTWLGALASMPACSIYYVKLVDPDTCDIKYLYHVLQTLNLPLLKGGAGIPGLNRNDVYERCKIPLPPLDVQKEMVAEIESHQKHIDELKQEISEEEKKIKSTINRVWGKEG